MKNLDLLIPHNDPSKNYFRWGTVTENYPGGSTPWMRVRLDGELESLPVTPDLLVDRFKIQEGDRVWCQISGHALIVLGVAGGEPDPPPPTPTIDHVTTVEVTVGKSGTSFNMGTATTPLVFDARYRVTWTGSVSSNTAGAWTEVQLRYAVGAGTGGTLFAQGPVDHRIANRAVLTTIVGTFTYAGTDGATNNIVAVGVSNAGTSSHVVNSARTCFLTVDRIA